MYGPASTCEKSRTRTPASGRPSRRRQRSDGRSRRARGVGDGALRKARAGKATEAGAAFHLLGSERCRGRVAANPPARSGFRKRSPNDATRAPIETTSWIPMRGRFAYRVASPCLNRERAGAAGTCESPFSSGSCWCWSRRARGPRRPHATRRLPQRAPTRARSTLRCSWSATPARRARHTSHCSTRSLPQAGARVRALGADRVAVVFLGDNVYPAGLRATEHAGRAEDERRLEAQLDAARRSGARGILVPGNHDWANSIPTRLGRGEARDALRRGARRGAAAAGRLPGARFRAARRPSRARLPRHPMVAAARRPAGRRRLRAARKPANPRSSARSPRRCARPATGTASCSRHHPLRSGGPHGGIYGWKEHLFPLREFRRSLWIPLPVIGSIRPLARTARRERAGHSVGGQPAHARVDRARLRARRRRCSSRRDTITRCSCCAEAVARDSTS